jgi:hypothetical protein
LIPLDGFGRIRNNALTLGVTATKKTLCREITLFGSKPVPLRGLGWISSNTTAVGITQTKKTLRGRKALIGS